MAAAAKLKSAKRHQKCRDGEIDSLPFVNITNVNEWETNEQHAKSKLHRKILTFFLLKHFKASCNKILMILDFANISFWWADMEIFLQKNVFKIFLNFQKSVGNW